MSKVPEANRRAASLFTRYAQSQAKLHLKRLNHLRKEREACKATPTINRTSTALVNALKKAIMDVPSPRCHLIAQALKQHMQAPHGSSEATQQQVVASAETSSASLTVTVKLGQQRLTGEQPKALSARSPELLETSSGVSYGSIKQLMQDTCSSLGKTNHSEVASVSQSSECTPFTTVGRLYQSPMPGFSRTYLSPSIKHVTYPSGCDLLEFTKKAKPLVSYACIAREA